MNAVYIKWFFKTYFERGVILVTVSVVSRRGRFAIVISEDGIEKKSVSETIKGSNENIYRDLIYAFHVGLRYLKQYVEETGSKKVTFVCSNSIFVRWVNEFSAKDEYQEEFMKMLGSLNEIPIEYEVVYQKKPLALKYLHERKSGFCLSGIDVDAFSEV